MFSSVVKECRQSMDITKLMHAKILHKVFLKVIASLSGTAHFLLAWLKVHST